jgi:hypothetical protein
VENLKKMRMNPLMMIQTSPGKLVHWIAPLFPQHQTVTRHILVSEKVLDLVPATPKDPMEEEKESSLIQMN